MTTFDDYEPEDAWNIDDPVPEQIVNLRRRLALLLDTDDAYAGPSAELDLFAAVLQLVRVRRLSARNALRADDLSTDIAVVRDRLRAQ
jgi:hypothetical protein